MTHTGSHLTRAAAIAVSCLVLSAGNSLLGQESEVKPKPPEDVSHEVKAKPPEVVSGEVDRQLWLRGREILHNGDPLDVIGLEEGDNGFRQRTPILEQSDRAVAMVDPDENRRRRLAMYSDRGSFTEPLAFSAVAASGSRFGKGGPELRPSVPAEEAEGGSHHLLLWVGSVVLIFLLFLRWWVKHKLAWQ